MNITVEENVPTLQSLPHHHLGGGVLRALFHTGSNPLSVEIEATKGGSLNAYYYSIGVQHGNDFKDEIVS